MKLVVSVMPKSLEEAQGIDAMRYIDADIIEWRADFLPKEAILQVAPAIFEKFAGRELLFTLRTRAEGLVLQELSCLIQPTMRKTILSVRNY